MTERSQVIESEGFLEEKEDRRQTSHRRESTRRPEVSSRKSATVWCQELEFRVSRSSLPPSEAPRPACAAVHASSTGRLPRSTWRAQSGHAPRQRGPGLSPLVSDRTSDPIRSDPIPTRQIDDGLREQAKQRGRTPRMASLRGRRRDGLTRRRGSAAGHRRTVQTAREREFRVGQPQQQSAPGDTNRVCESDDGGRLTVATGGDHPLSSGRRPQKTRRLWGQVLKRQE
jgi:hypothetical protein